MADLNQLIKEGIFDIELGVANPRVGAGVAAGIGAVGQSNTAPPTFWRKFGLNDTDWEQGFYSENGVFTGAFELLDAYGTAPEQYVLSRIGPRSAIIGDGVSQAEDLPAIYPGPYIAKTKDFERQDLGDASTWVRLSDLELNVDLNRKNARGDTQLGLNGNTIQNYPVAFLELSLEAAHTDDGLTYESALDLAVGIEAEAQFTEVENADNGGGQVISAFSAYTVIENLPSAEPFQRDVITSDAEGGSFITPYVLAKPHMVAIFNINPTPTAPGGGYFRIKSSMTLYIAGSFDYQAEEQIVPIKFYAKKGSGSSATKSLIIKNIVAKGYLL